MQFHGSNGAEIIDIATWCRRARFARRTSKLRRHPDVIEAVISRALGRVEVVVPADCPPGRRRRKPPGPPFHLPPAGPA